MNDPNLREHSRDLPTGLSHRPRDGSVVSSLQCVNDPQPEGHMASYIGRRKFLATRGGAVAWPPAARAQQAAIPVIGFLSSSGSLLADRARFLTAFRQGVRETGYVEGQNVAIEYRVGSSQTGRIRGIGDGMVRRQVTVIA